MKKTLYLLPLLLILCFSACEIIDPDDILTPITADTTTYHDQRIILLEEYTGNMCPNCPDAAVEVEKLMKMYPNRIVVIAIHSGVFARPIPTRGYTADFRTTVGDSLTNHYGVGAYPNGIINRALTNGTYLHGHGEWESIIGELVADTTAANANITVNVTPNADDSSYNVVVNTVAKQYGNLKLCVYVTEDNLVCQQASGQETIPDYNHDHVLRGSLNGTWGEAIGNESSKAYNLSVAGTGWNPENLNIVAFIYDETNQTVLQTKQVRCPAL